MGIGDYRIFLLNERLREGFDKNLDPKEVKTQASKDWKMISYEDREVCFERKKDNDDWFKGSKHTKKVTPLSIYVKKTIQSAKDKNKEPPKLAEIGPAWKKLPNSEKEKLLHINVCSTNDSSLQIDYDNLGKL